MRETRIDLGFAVAGIAVMAMVLAAVLAIAGSSGCANQPEPQWPPTIEVHGGGGDGWIDVSVSGTRYLARVGADHNDGATCLRAVIEATVPPWGIVHADAILPPSDEACGPTGVQEVRITPFRPGAGDGLARPGDNAGDATVAPAAAEVAP